MSTAAPSILGSGAPGRRRRRNSRFGLLVLLGSIGAAMSAGLGLLVLAVVMAGAGAPEACPASEASPGSGQSIAASGQSIAAPNRSIAVSSAGRGTLVGASEYGGPGDPSSGTIGASGVSLLAHPDSYAELGGDTFQTATAIGGLPYMTPLRITWSRRSAVAYKRDFGFGGGPIDGLPRVIDLWWQLAVALGIPYEHGLWSGPIRISAVPGSGAGAVLGQSDASLVPPGGSACAVASIGPLPLTPGTRARLLPGGTAAAPADAPAAVRGIIAAGNQIVGKPYLYGGGHGLPLDQIAPSYDCSSSVEHLLYGGGLLPVGYDAASGALESFGRPGPGRWVTIYASADHVFIYVAGLRWDTHNAAGPQDGSAGIGWHPLVRDASGFVARHPVGL